MKQLDFMVSEGSHFSSSGGKLWIRNRESAQDKQVCNMKTVSLYFYVYYQFILCIDVGLSLASFQSIFPPNYICMEKCIQWNLKKAGAAGLLRYIALWRVSFNTSAGQEISAGNVSFKH